MGRNPNKSLLVGEDEFRQHAVAGAAELPRANVASVASRVDDLGGKKEGEVGRRT
jgi:hypothetical protein